MARDCSWSVDGVPLATHLFNVMEVGSDVLPDLRGSDVVFSGFPGQSHRPKVPDSREVTLGGWIVGEVLTGGSVSGAVLAAEEHMTALLRLLRPDGGRQVVVGRSWVDASGVHSDEALAEVRGVSSVQHGRANKNVTITLRQPARPA